MNENEIFLLRILLRQLTAGIDKELIGNKSIKLLGNLLGEECQLFSAFLACVDVF